MQLETYAPDTLMYQLIEDIEAAGGKWKIRKVVLTEDEYLKLRAEANDLPETAPESELKHVSSVANIPLYVNETPVYVIAQEEARAEMERVLSSAGVELPSDVAKSLQ